MCNHKYNNMSDDKYAMPIKLEIIVIQKFFLIDLDVNNLSLNKLAQKIVHVKLLTD